MERLLGLLVLVGCARTPDVDALRDETTSIAVAQQPALDALVTRIERLKRELRGNRVGWEPMLRFADLANDELGLPPFTQTVPPGPEWVPSPATLLGIGNYVRKRAAQLAQHVQVDELNNLIADERRRYASGILQVNEHLARVESWLAASR